MSRDREDLHREIDTAANHAKTFAQAILDCTPTITWCDNRLSIAFDEAEQAVDAFNLLWAAIDSVKPASTEEE